MDRAKRSGAALNTVPGASRNTPSVHVAPTRGRSPGSQVNARRRLPNPNPMRAIGSVACDVRVTAYSRGGGHGWGPFLVNHSMFPFKPKANCYWVPSAGGLLQIVCPRTIKNSKTGSVIRHLCFAYAALQHKMLRRTKSAFADLQTHAGWEIF